MIGILTFYWADDYGAMLQAYALKHYLERSGGRKVTIIPYAPLKLTGRYWLYPLVASKVDGKLKYRFVTYRFKRNMAFFKKFVKRRKNMRAFRRAHLTWKPAKRQADRISLEKYSRVFVGSDQVWNPEITVGLDDAYIGNVKEKGKCKLIAYAASFGGSAISEEFRPDFQKAIDQNFAAVSLREKSAVPFVEELLGKNVIDVLDPTLLLEKNEWEELGKLPQEQGYILFVYTEYNEQMIQYLHQLSMDLHKKVIQVSMPWPGEKEEWIDIRIDGGPSEFIGYFQNADYVVTNSFHGMVFSVLLEKQFLVFSHSNKNARIDNFLGKLHLKDRLIESSTCPSNEIIEHKIDWKSVKQLLEIEKDISIGFIRDNCEDMIR